MARLRRSTRNPPPSQFCRALPPLYDDAPRALKPTATRPEGPSRREQKRRLAAIYTATLPLPPLLSILSAASRQVPEGFDGQIPTDFTESWIASVLANMRQENKELADRLISLGATIEQQSAIAGASSLLTSSLLTSSY